MDQPTLSAAPSDTPKKRGSPPPGEAPPAKRLKESSGRWSAEEHQLFIGGLEAHGKDWKLLASLIPSRTVVQIRTHAQKYFQKVSKAGLTTREPAAPGRAHAPPSSPTAKGRSATQGSAVAAKSTAGRRRRGRGDTAAGGSNDGSRPTRDPADTSAARSAKSAAKAEAEAETEIEVKAEAGAAAGAKAEAGEAGAEAEAEAEPAAEVEGAEVEVEAEHLAVTVAAVARAIAAVAVAVPDPPSPPRTSSPERPAPVPLSPAPAWVTARRLAAPAAPAGSGGLAVTAAASRAMTPSASGGGGGCAVAGGGDGHGVERQAQTQPQPKPVEAEAEAEATIEAAKHSRSIKDSPLTALELEPVRSPPPSPYCLSEPFTTLESPASPPPPLQGDLELLTLLTLLTASERCDRFADFGGRPFSVGTLRPTPWSELELPENDLGGELASGPVTARPGVGHVMMWPQM